MLPDEVLPRYGHSAVTTDLCAGLAEVVLIGGCPNYVPTGLVKDAPRLAEIASLTFGEYELCCSDEDTIATICL